MTTPPILEMTDVCAEYGPFRALFGVTLTIGPGDALALDVHVVSDRRIDLSGRIGAMLEWDGGRHEWSFEGDVALKAERKLARSAQRDDADRQRNKHDGKHGRIDGHYGEHGTSRFL